MYAAHFGLKQEPFSIAPDPRYLFMSERHREALAHLLYGVGGGGGFVLLSGEIGAGKTTVCRCFLEQIPRRCNVAYIFNPKLSVIELMRSICEEFGIPVPATAGMKDHVDALNEFLLRTHGVGQNNILIIDEAQSLSAELLEQLRLLTNLETAERKLLQIILIGQPELRDMLRRPELEQLAQRVIARFHLKALSADETGQYIQHRLAVAGSTRDNLFDDEAVKRVHAVSRGVPRRINLLCDRALLGAYAEGKRRVSRRMVDKAALEVFGKAERVPKAPLAAQRNWLWAAAAAACFLAGGAALGWAIHAARQERQAAAPAAAPAVFVAGVGPVSPASAAAVVAAASLAPADPPPPAAVPPTFVRPAQLRSLFKKPLRQEREAWRELAPLWQLPTEAEDICQAAARSAVQCWKRNVTLATIKQLDRPGILSLFDDAERPLYALLTGLSEQSATLRVGSEVREVTLVSLATVWRGDFATFWRAPPGYSAKLSDGERGPTVDWLAQQLARISRQPEPPPGRVFDDTLRQRLVAFQSTQGLKPDGVAGPTTFMQINRAIGVAEARLQGAR